VQEPRCVLPAKPLCHTIPCSAITKVTSVSVAWLS